MVTIGGGETKWVFFNMNDCLTSTPRLPNFYSRCGRLDYGEKECLEKTNRDNGGNEEGLQYGAWLRGEPGRRGGGDQGRTREEYGGEDRMNKGETTRWKQVDDKL